MIRIGAAAGERRHDDAVRHGETAKGGGCEQGGVDHGRQIGR